MWGELKCVPRLGHALLRGRYSKAVARMEWYGIPIDTELLQRLRENWDRLKDELIDLVDAQFGVCEGRTFKQAGFAENLLQKGLTWPRMTSVRLALNANTFSTMVQ